MRANLPNSPAQTPNFSDNSPNSPANCQNLPERAHSPTSTANASSLPIISNHALNLPETSVALESMPPNSSSPAYPTSPDSALSGESDGEYVVSSDNESDSDNVAQDDIGCDSFQDEYVVSSDSDSDTGDLRECNVCHHALTKESYSNSQWKRFERLSLGKLRPPRCRRCVERDIQVVETTRPPMRQRCVERDIQMKTSQCGPSAVSHSAFPSPSSHARAMPPSSSVSPPPQRSSLKITPTTKHHNLSAAGTTTSLSPLARSSPAIRSPSPSLPTRPSLLLPRPSPSTTAANVSAYPWGHPAYQKNRNTSENVSTDLHLVSNEFLPLVTRGGASTNYPDLTMDQPHSADPRWECQVCHRLLRQNSYSKTQFKRFNKITMKPNPSKAPPACRKCINSSRRGNGASAHPAGAESPGRSHPVKKQTDPHDVNDEVLAHTWGLDPEPTDVHISARGQKTQLPVQAQGNDSLVGTNDTPVAKVTANGNNRETCGG